MKSYLLEITTLFITPSHLCSLTLILHGLNIPYRFIQLQEGYRGGRSCTAVQKLIFSCSDENLVHVKEYMDGMVEDVYVTEPVRKLFGGTKDVRKYPMTTFKYTIEKTIP